ncbi:MeTHuselah (aging-associated GPCR) like protein [Ditylenchus destructor]|nr:MeTHuselah (aging-associated GPCR) like protein [Ditylenchus destructor]
MVIPNKDTYHVYGAWDTPGQRYEYYFKISYTYNKTIYLSCVTSFFFINKKLTYMELGVGTNMSVQQPDNGLTCRDGEVSDWLINNVSHFTVFANMFTYDEWKPLVSLDWLYLRKNYQPGNCSYIKEMRADGNVHSFCVCKRLNNTERYCGIQMQEKEIPTTTRIIFRGTTKKHERSLITSFPSFMTDIDELLQTIQGLLHMETIPDEDTNAVLLAMDTLLDTNSLTQETSSRLMNFLDYLMKHSCCDIYFVGNRSFAVLRQSVNCATTNREKWPVLRDDLIKSDHLHRNRFGASIWIPYETVCYRNTSQESILAYFMFYNQALFVENHSVSDNCEVNLHIQTNLPVLGAQYINNSEEVHQIFINGKYMPMVNIMFNKEEIPSPLHGLLKLAHWNSGKWSYTENTKMKVYDDKRIWEVNHLTDFTLVVDGIDMDPILCDIFLDYISMCLNCASTVSLLILTSITIRQRFSRTKSKYNHFQRIMSKFYGIRISYYISLTFLHFGFAMLSDSRRLFWPFTCEIAAVILYWILLVCIFTTAFQSMKLSKIVVNTSVIERILNKLTSTKSSLLFTLGIASCSTLILKKFVPKFFIRRDTFCWIRPDYVIPAVILPVGILGLCSTGCFVTIFIRYVLQEKLFGVSLQRGSSSVKTIVRGSLSTNCPSSVSDMDIWLKYIDKASVIICMQLMLGLPWICQYFTLFVPRLTAAHYIFTIAVGSQGLMLMMVYCCRKIKNQYNRSNCKR